MANAIDIEVKGLIKAQRKQEQVIRDLHGEPVLNAMRDATLIVTRAAKKNAPVDTGRLRASITPEVRMMGETTTGVIGSNVKYAADQEFGTLGPYLILPKNAWTGILHWVGKDGKDMFSKFVIHPGIKGKRYLQRAFEDNKDRIIRRLERGINQIVEKK